jgi:effector-binding domain-containing protein
LTCSGGSIGGGATAEGTGEDRDFDVVWMQRVLHDSRTGVVMAYEVEIRELAPEKLASVRGWYPAAEMAQVMGTEFGRILGAMSAQGMHPVGPPVAVYHAWTEESVDLELGFPVAGDFQEAQGVRPGTLPGGRVAFTPYTGPYDRIEPAYKAIQEYAGASGITLAPMMWERYLSDPNQEPDLSKHLTQIVWPLV